MIIPILCFTCGKPIADRWIEYEAKVNEYKKDPSKKPYPELTPEAQVLNELGMDRYCCRRMFLCQPTGLVNVLKNRITTH